VTRITAAGSKVRYDLVLKMSINRKLVSLLLVFLIPTASALALSVCPQDMTEMGKPQSGMAIMDMAPLQLSITATQTNLCCEVSPSEIPLGPVQPSGAGETHAVVIAGATGCAILQSAKARIVSDHVPKASSPPQALLCVFLI
jgi:hypothetical protein